MARTEADRVELVRFALLDAASGVAAATSTRRGGVSGGGFASMNLSRSVGDDPAAVLENRRRLAAAVGYAPERQVFAEQVHGSRIAVVEAGGAGMPGAAGAVAAPQPATWMVPGVDGLVTDRPGVALTAMSADCPCLAAYDTARHVAGAAHASWRGTAANMAGSLVRVLADRYGSRPGDLVVGIAPSIGPCCFDVREDFVATMRAALPYADEYLRTGAGDRRTFDLWSCNRRQLLDAGVPAERIEVAGACTRCRPELFYSYRREGARGGRFGTVVVLR
ncbi:MAG: peptidoglycan editing factor PgeF [Planctomycetes bacterium]|nr:peptidoglycan editing factor PgeF [Planctomycetota bacterium]